MPDVILHPPEQQVDGGEWAHGITRTVLGTFQSLTGHPGRPAAPPTTAASQKGTRCFQITCLQHHLPERETTITQFSECTRRGYMSTNPQRDPDQLTSPSLKTLCIDVGISWCTYFVHGLAPSLRVRRLSIAVYYLTRRSWNRKTGPIPVTMTSAETCPESCAFKGAGCYAEYGPLGLHWNALTRQRKGYPLDEFCEAIRRLRGSGGPARHNQAGDLPGIAERIDREELRQLVAAMGRSGLTWFTYTHKPMTPENRKAIDMIQGQGLVINLSATSPREADQLRGLGVGPVTTVLPFDAGERQYRTPGGQRLIVCPAHYRETVTCMSCGSGRPLCARLERDYVIGFPAHGAGRRKASHAAGDGVSEVSVD